MLAAGLDVLKNRLSSDKMVDDISLAERANIVSDIYKAMLDAASVSVPPVSVTDNPPVAEPAAEPAADPVETGTVVPVVETQASEPEPSVEKVDDENSEFNDPEDPDVEKDVVSIPKEPIVDPPEDHPHKSSHHARQKKTKHSSRS